MYINRGQTVAKPVVNGYETKAEEVAKEEAEEGEKLGFVTLGASQMFQVLRTSGDIFIFSFCLPKWPFRNLFLVLFFYFKKSKFSSLLFGSKNS